MEYPFPYENHEDELARRLREHGLTQALINLPAGDWAAGERGIACHPGRTEEFREGVADSYSGTPRRSTARGRTAWPVFRRRAPRQRRRSQAALLENLRYAGEAFRDAGLQLLIEPINTRDIPGFFLNTSAQGLAVIEEIGGRALMGLQYDAYHMQIMEGDLARTVEDHLGVIGHIQIADTPGRHEPGTGEVNYPFFLNHLDAIGYDGWVGCEYAPATTTEAGLGVARRVSSERGGVMTRIAFIGLGIMGRPMAGHLQAAGHELFVVRHVSPLPAELLEGGAVECATAAEAASRSEVVITMVPDTPDVADVLFGAGGVAEGLQAGTTVIDMSSNLADRDEAVRRAHRREGLRLPGCARLRGRGRGKGGQPHDYGGRQRRDPSNGRVPCSS